MYVTANLGEVTQGKRESRGTSHHAIRREPVLSENDIPGFTNLEVS